MFFLLMLRDKRDTLCTRLYNFLQKITNRSCVYWKHICWFKHNDDEIYKTSIETNEDETKENTEVIERIIEMMESLTNLIVHMKTEKKIFLNN